jgi:hypothetical protein
MQNDQARLNIAQQGENRQQEQFKQGGVSEQQASYLLSRVGGGIDDLNYIAQNMKGGTGAPSLGDAIAYDSFGPNSVFTRGLTSEGRRAVEDVQLDILDALLTLGTGAAYNKEQLAGQRAAYFPQFNDSEQAIALKRRRLERLFDDSIARAGPLADRLRDYKGKFLSPMGAAKQPTLKDQAPLGVRLRVDGGPNDVFDRAAYLQERFGISPSMETRLVGMVNANNGNPNVTPEMIAGFYEAAGMGKKDPNSAEIRRMAEDLRSGKFAPATGLDTTAAEKAYLQGLDTIIERAGFNPEGAGPTAANALRQGLAFEGFDEITGVVNAIAEGLQGNDPIAGYQTGRDVVRRMNQRGDDENPVIGFAGRLVGGVPTGTVGAAGRVNSLASAARVGGIEGGIYGFNSGQGVEGSALGAVTGGISGAALGTGFHSAGNKIQAALRARRAPVDPGEVDSVLQAGVRREVTVRRPDVDPNIRQQRASLQQTERGRAAIAAADADDIAQIEAALVRDLGGRAGTIRSEAASTVQTGVKAARDTLRKRAGVEYRAAAAEAGNITAPATKAIALIDGQIAELNAAGAKMNASRIKYLQDMKADLSQGGGLSVNGLRGLRTDTRKNLENAGIYTSDFERRLSLVLNAASEDLDDALAAFPRAQARFREGDKLWSQQADFGKKVGDLLLGKDGNLSPGQAADRIMGWAKKDPARIHRLLQEVDDGTKEEVRALVVSQIGRQANGNFSLAALLTQTGQGRGGGLSPSAIRALFGDDGAKALADLRILSQAKTDAASATNRSQTGGIVQGAKNTVRRLVLGAIGFQSSAEPMTGALISGASIAGGEFFERLGQERALRLLLNPDFTHWLRTLPNSNNPAAINRSFAALRSTASRFPSMLTDVQAFERMLVEAVNDNEARLAAEPQGADQTRRGE